MVKIVKFIVIFLALLLLTAIFLPGCNKNTPPASNTNSLVQVFNSGISNIKTTSKGNNIIVKNIDCKEQMTKFCNDLRLKYIKKSENNLN